MKFFIIIALICMSLIISSNAQEYQGTKKFVITSYSIHYTKLYDVGLKFASQLSNQSYQNQHVLLESFLSHNFIKWFHNIWNFFNVITSYSIHYTKLYDGISSLDTCLNFLSTYDKICITGIKTQNIIERLCVRAQMPHRYGGIETKVLLIDGANTTDLYQCVDYAQQYGLDVRKILHGIISSRTFTVYQIANIIIHELENAISHYKVKIVIITSLLHFFTKGMFLDRNNFVQHTLYEVIRIRSSGEIYGDQVNKI